MKKKLMVVFVICTIILTFSACKNNEEVKESDEKELVTLVSTDIVVNEDGSFAIEGEMNHLGTTLKIDGVRLTPSVDANNKFVANIQMADPVDSAVLEAIYLLDKEDTQQITVNLDTSKYVVMLQKTQEAEQLKQEHTNALNLLVSSSLIDAKTRLEELAYTPSYFYEASNSDCTAEMSNADAEWLSGWVVTKVEAIDTENHTVKIYISTQERVVANQETAKALATLQEKLEAGYAWQAVEEYGERQYPYGFKLHSIMGKLAEQAEDENTWILKAECDVTNTFNAEAKLTCEARVTGTNDNPDVISFTVY